MFNNRKRLELIYRSEELWIILLALNLLSQKYSIISILVCNIAFKLLGLQLSSPLISRVGNILDSSTLNYKPEF